MNGGHFMKQGIEMLKNDPTLTPPQLCQKLGCKERNARKIVSKFRKALKLNIERSKPIDEKKEKVNFETKKDIATLESVKSERITTLNQLLDFAQIDTRVWEVEKFQENKWEAHCGNGDAIPLFQVKAWLKRKIQGLDLEELIESVKKDLADYSPQWSPVKYNPGNKHLLEVNIFDLHYGKLSWKGETGENYDRKIAIKRFNTAIHNLVERAKTFGVEKILFPIGNDFFNVDNDDNTTTAGTKQHEDGRWQKTFLEGKDLLIDAISYLREVAPVDVILVPGNHDEQRSFYLATVLEAFFNKCPGVTIDVMPVQRKYVQYGKCLIGLSHGASSNAQPIKAEKYPIIMASEAPELWAKTKYREMHLGHFHHLKAIQMLSTEDFVGVTVRYLRSLTGKDAWHKKSGFIGMQQSAEAFLWHRDNGMVANLIYNL